MLLEILTTPCSATFELCNGSAYRSPHGHRLWLDGHLQGEVDRNVFTISGLRSNTRYRLEVESGGVRHALVFHTARERCRVDVRMFGAAGDGRTDNTAAIQAALAACPEDGVVELPAGEWLSGPLFLRSGVDLYLARDSRLIGHPDPGRWPVLPGIIGARSAHDDYFLASWEGQPADCHAALINGIGVCDVRIHGEGTIDANAGFDTWWARPKQPFAGWRPRTVYFVSSRRVGISGVTLCNSPSWTVHALLSRELCFADLTIQSPPRSPNTDGIVPESCEAVTIAGARISTGDDCLSIKSGKAWIAAQIPCATRQVSISNCALEQGHGGVVIGSEMSGGVYDVTVRDCQFTGTERGIRIKTRRGRGPHAVIDGARFENLLMRGVGTVFAVNSFYFCDPDGRTPYVGTRTALPADDGTPTLRNIHISGVDCEAVAHSAGFVLGLPERPVDGLTLSRYRVRFDPHARPGFPDRAETIPAMARGGLYICNARRVLLDGLDIEGCDGPRLVLENAGE